MSNEYPAFRARTSKQRRGPHNPRVLNGCHVVERHFEKAGQVEKGIQAQILENSALELADGRGRQAGVLGERRLGESALFAKARNPPGQLRLHEAR